MSNVIDNLRNILGVIGQLIFFELANRANLANF